MLSRIQITAETKSQELMPTANGQSWSGGGLEPGIEAKEGLHVVARKWLRNAANEHPLWGQLIEQHRACVLIRDNQAGNAATRRLKALTVVGKHARGLWPFVGLSDTDVDVQPHRALRYATGTTIADVLIYTFNGHKFAFRGIIQADQF